ncbi:hypothetical protein bpr_IV135 (plasmid) [Butyrivibrio proteoclasticus B316]|uniref:Uncharacterized protein n=1 Tax=Butyrivibrio proteoclasticus (strain ATCC 51982 / DSM 14932 / B316) TaxID=515622 RepID=E0S517_BUTPB|nr:hypothetical protein [Butyrivibrio proteoclasticus]ADL36499.1 hypothetical protein bpr_IV135 [Butyrivibrio proteoclasticus B316]
MEFEKIKEKIHKNPKSINVLYRWLMDKEFSGAACEELCKYLLDNKELFDKHFYRDLVRVNCNGDSLEYRYDSRDGATDSEPRKDKNGKIDEKHLAMIIFKQGRKGKELVKIDNLGFILDYEMPIGGNTEKLLKENGELRGICDPDPNSNPSKNSMLFNPGKCDLVSFDNNCFTILELKKEDNTEPLVRAVMEAYTYREMLNKSEAADSLRGKYRGLSIPEGNTIWKAAPLLPFGESQYKEYMSAGPKLIELMDFLEIKPIWYSYSEKDKKISVVKYL